MTGWPLVMALVAAMVLVGPGPIAHAAALILVTNTADGGPGSLRAAIELANSDGIPDTIMFNIPTSDPGFNGRWFTISPLSPLPSLTEDGTTVDGSSQTAFTGDTNPAGPEIFLDGRSQPVGQAFEIASNRNLIRGLVMSGFPYQAILIQKFPIPEPLMGNVVRGSYIGTDPTGRFAIPNGARFGSGFTPALSVAMGLDTIIGGTGPGDGNLVSGNVSFGVDIVIRSRRTIVQGNRIGTDATGTRALPNLGHGVNIGAFGGVTFDNVIGGSAAGAGNLISGNGGAGIFVTGTGHVIQGNLIGTDVTGTAAIPNQFSGILMQDADVTVIGGTTAAARNVISANGEHGILSHGGADNVIQGNFIGTDATGAIALGNGRNGISDGGTRTLIGGAEPGAGNVISGNGLIPFPKHGRGVDVIGDLGARVQGNLIGTDATGTRALPNLGTGLTLDDGTGALVGGTSAGARNVISGNAGGIGIFGASGNVVQGNFIGTDISGARPLGNQGTGIVIGLGGGNIVGGTAAGSGNVISANRDQGIFIAGSDNTVRGNFIGTDATGTVGLANGFDGVFVSGPTDNLGQPTGPAAANNTLGDNVISANAGGVHFEFAETNVVQGNLIGTDVTGTVALGNKTFGVFTGARSTGNLIGGSTAAGRNLVSGNVLVGMKLGGTADVIEGNYVGVDASGLRALGNGFGQFAIQPGVGGPGIALREVDALVTSNVVSGNAGSGLQIFGSRARVEGNLVGTNAIGSAAIPNGFSGISIGGGTDNVIGGTTATQRNLISGNPQFGIFIGNGARNTVQGNFIGTDATGAAAIGNGGAPSQCCGGGIRVQGTSANVLIGGTMAGAGNLISGNKIGVGAINASGITVQGNLIGTDASGSAAIPNLQNGVRFFANVSDALIGGTTPGARNVISGNTVNGVSITGASGNTVQGNYIGTNAAGSAALPNGLGVFLSDGAPFTSTATSNLVGGTTPGARNVISGNAGPGIVMNGTGLYGNAIQGNYIGLDPSGDLALSNSAPGIVLRAPHNLIGGTALGAGNVISGNSANSGIHINVGGVGNLIQGNLIGTNAAGTAARPNLGGIVIVDGATDNLIGGADAGASNTIAFNTRTGVALVSGGGTSPVRDRISRNSIFSNGALGIDLGADGVTPNHAGGAPLPGPNQLQNFPVLGTAEVVGGNVVVTGAIDTPNPATATVELFGNDVADPSGFGEGQKFGGSASPGLTGCFTATIPATLAGRFVTTTATDGSGNTSEFSAALPVGATKAAIALAPATATNTIGQTHTVVATLTNSASGPVPCAEITFSVNGANTAAGSATTDIAGRASFGYTGVWAGGDTITARSGAVSGSATKTWLFPASTPGRVTGGGQITNPSSHPNFGITAQGATGQLEYNDRGVRNVHSTRIAATVISGSRATIYGFATVDRAGDVQFRVAVEDNGEPGNNDAFRIVMRDGYIAGGVLAAGNIAIH